MSAITDEAELAALQRFQRFLAFEKMEKAAAAIHQQRVVETLHAQDIKESISESKEHKAVTPGTALSEIAPEQGKKRPYRPDMLLELVDEDIEPVLDDYTTSIPPECNEGKLLGGSWRKALNNCMGCTDTSDVRTCRKFVLRAAISKGICLDRPFKSYPYFAQMYKLIKYIANYTGLKWGWDLQTTEDCIRILCLDRTRNKAYKDRKMALKRDNANVSVGGRSSSQQAITCSDSGTGDVYMAAFKGESDQYPTRIANNIASIAEMAKADSLSRYNKDAEGETDSLRSA